MRNLHKWSLDSRVESRTTILCKHFVLLNMIGLLKKLFHKNMNGFVNWIGLCNEACLTHELNGSKCFSFS